MVYLSLLAKNIIMVYELSEEEFLTILKKFMEKAKILEDTEALNQYINLLEKYQKFKKASKKRNYILKFYYNEETSELYFYPISKEEYEIFRKKWTLYYGIA